MTCKWIDVVLFTLPLWICPGHHSILPSSWQSKDDPNLTNPITCFKSSPHASIMGSTCIIYADEHCAVGCCMVPMRRVENLDEAILIAIPVDCGRFEMVTTAALESKCGESPLAIPLSE
ncbi:uncharacterized protein EI90DRAFT_3022467 [Cantharellus anzutake]|uniref:uncharacterized protein n=1 Tax=Cantharellus anzutake TaxID=1750568 RepID=UPI0019063F24|nr:uncharacterized protein EI90DRAFT_3022467 [Cantharellus anzutake]KAF8314120.1 hypothetical protein EI90DRAFT_3022467 [Cantharellus anzutake]